MALPIRVADHHGSGGAPLGFFNRESAADERLNGKDAKEVRTNARRSAVLRSGAQYHRRFARRVVGHRLKGQALVAPILNVGDRYLPRKRCRHLTGGPKVGESDDSIRIAIGKRLQDHGVHDAENSRVGTDAERQRHHGHRREAGILRQHAQVVPNVLPKRLDGVPSPHFPAPLFGQGYVPEPAQRCIVSFLGRHA